jgi:hypothetical protein
MEKIIVTDIPQEYLNVEYKIKMAIAKKVKRDQIKQPGMSHQQN